jgi:hypothetical protein
MTADSECVRIEIEYADGTIEYATGDHAVEVLKYLNWGQQMAAIHGMPYARQRMLTRPS